MLLDKGFKSDCARLMQITLRTPPATRFESLLKQRHFQVLIIILIKLSFFYFSYLAAQLI